MRISTPRILPLEPADWNEEQSSALGFDIGELQSKIGHEGKVFNVLKTLVRYPALLKAWLGFANHIMFDSSLSPRDREIAILRIGWLCQSGYEFGQHILMGMEAGLSEDEIKWIVEGAGVDHWSEAEQALIKATDELHDDAFVSNRTFADLQKFFNEQQILDIIFTVGQYNMVSMALNTAGVQLDEGIPDYKSFLNK
jgi:4-carboxymuconolactone decarboxylase